MIQTINPGATNLGLDLQSLLENQSLTSASAASPLSSIKLSSAATEALETSSSAAGARAKISLTPQSLATIITNAVVKTVEAVLSIIVARLPGLSGTAPTNGTAGSSVNGSSNADTGSSVQEAAENSSIDDTNNSTSANTSVKEPGFLESAQTVISEFKDILFNKETGIITSLKEMFGELLPTKTLKSLGKVFKTLQKNFKKLLPKATSTVKNLFDSGKKLLSKIF